MYVDVYRNLVKGGLSVKAREGPEQGRVVDYVEEATVRDVEFVVQPAGRQRVLDEQVKNVHAFVRGQRVEDPDPVPDDAVHVVYDPYEYADFVIAETEEPIREARVAHVAEGGVMAVTDRQ